MRQWEQLRSERMVAWIKRPWDELELLFMSMAAAQITTEDLRAFQSACGLAIKPCPRWSLNLMSDMVDYADACSS